VSGSGQKMNPGRSIPLGMAVLEGIPYTASDAHDGALTLADHPVPMVHLRCRKCGRFGRYRLARLMAEYGPNAKAAGPAPPARQMPAHTSQITGLSARAVPASM
jgi:hypothetical protein